MSASAWDVGSVWAGPGGWSPGGGGAAFAYVELALADLDTPSDPGGILVSLTQAAQGLAISYTGDGTVRDGSSEGITATISNTAFWDPSLWLGNGNELASFVITEVAAFTNGANVPFAGIGLIDPSVADSGVFGAIAMIAAATRAGYTGNSTGGATGGSSDATGRYVEVMSWSSGTSRGAASSQLLTAGGAIASSAGPFPERSSSGAGDWTADLDAFVAWGYDTASSNTYTGTYRYSRVTPNPTVRPAALP